MKRVFLIVLDSFGIGEMEDAEAYGDIGTNVLRSVSPKLCVFHAYFGIKPEFAGTSML